MKTHKHTKLDQKGVFSWHMIVPVVVIIGVAAIGVHLLEASRAATLPTNGIFATSTGYLLNNNGSDASSVFPSDNSTLSDVTWSPNGNQVAYVTGSSTITVSSPNGTNAKQIYTTTDANGINQLAWSPDGTWIAFTSPSSQTIGLVHADGTGFTQVNVPDAFNSGSFYWSTDSSSLVAFQSPGSMNSGASQQMCTIPVNGTASCAASPLATTVTAAALSPDNTRLAYSAQPSGSTTSAVFIANTSGGNVEQISPSGMNATGPVWSPDGTKVAYEVTSASTSTPSNSLYISTAASTPVTTKITTAAPMYPGTDEVAWQPVTSATTFKLVIATSCSYNTLPSTVSFGQVVNPQVTYTNTGTVPVTIAAWNEELTQYTAANATYASASMANSGTSTTPTMPVGGTSTLYGDVLPTSADHVSMVSAASAGATAKEILSFSGSTYPVVAGLSYPFPTSQTPQHVTCSGATMTLPSVVQGSCSFYDVPSTVKKGKVFDAGLRLLNTGNKAFTPTIKETITPNSGTATTSTIKAASLNPGESDRTVTYTVGATTKATSATVLVSVSGATKVFTCSTSFKID